MTSERSDSLTSEDLDNLVMDAPDKFFKPTLAHKIAEEKRTLREIIRQPLKCLPIFAQSPTSEQAALTEMLKHAVEQPAQVKQLILACQAFKKHGWMDASRVFRRYAFALGEFQSKEQFAIFKGESDCRLPNLFEGEDDFVFIADQRYLEFAFEKVEQALDEMRKIGQANGKPTKSIERSLKYFRDIALAAE